MLLSVVVPTYNEGRNIGPLVAQVRTALLGIEHEVVVVDDASQDGTPRLARQAGARVVERSEKGLATAVVRGIAESRGTYVAVMDADFQHPPSAVRAMLERARATDADLVVGSRYTDGGTEGDFPLARRLVSRGAASLAQLALPPVRRFHLTDPMSGLFLVRRDRVDPAALQPTGYKVLLEVLERGRLERVQEVGYRFGARAAGDSKLGARTILQYLAHLAALAAQDPENRRLARFALVGASGVLVNVLVLFLLVQLAGAEYHFALLAALEASVLSNFLLNDAFTFRDHHEDGWWARLGLFHLVSFFGLVASFAAQSLLVDFLALDKYAAIPFGVLAGFVPNWLGNRRFTYGGAARPRASRWLPYAILAVAACGLYLGGLGPAPALDAVGLQGSQWGIRDVYFDEHYYVTVAHQLENGILEDPCWGPAYDPANPQPAESDGERPLNYEHPPLAKLILWASVHAYDTDHSVFTGCRDPNNDRHEACQLVDGGQTRSFDDGKQCYDAFTQTLRAEGNPYAWRGPSALFGVATVLCIALAARRLFASDLAGALAGSLVLLDTLVVTSSRIALLDIFATGFAAAAVLRATYPSRRAVLDTALLLGLGFSCKYYVLFAGPPVLLLSLWTHWRAGRLSGRRLGLHAALYPTVPLLVLLATYLPWWVLWTRRHGVAWAVEHWARIQASAVKWMATGQQDHAYVTPPAEWIALVKPMFYIGPGQPYPPGDFLGAYVYAVGNPAVWWLGSLAALAALGWWLVRLWAWAWRSVARARRVPPPAALFAGRPRWEQALLVAAALPLLTYGSFFLLTRSSFIFYMTLVAPFLALALAGALARLWRVPHAAAKWTVGAVCAVATLLFLWYAPVALYIPIPRSWFHTIFRLVPWMHECGKDLLCAD